MNADKEWFQIDAELRKGGDWLGAARSWMQSNVREGDRLGWSDGTPVSIPFSKLEELALATARAAVLADRRRRSLLWKSCDHGTVGWGMEVLSGFDPKLALHATAPGSWPSSFQVMSARTVTHVAEKQFLTVLLEGNGGTK